MLSVQHFLLSAQLFQSEVVYFQDGWWEFLEIVGKRFIQDATPDPKKKKKSLKKKEEFYPKLIEFCPNQPRMQQVKKKK